MRRHQHFGDVASAVRSEVSAGSGCELMRASAALAACRNSFIFLMVLFARRAFDARAGIHAPGLRQRDGARDVGGIQAAREDDAAGAVRRQRPVEGLPGAAVEFAGRSVQQQRFGGAVRRSRAKSKPSSTRAAFHTRECRRIIGGRLVAVQLRDVERRDARDLFDARRAAR